MILSSVTVFEWSPFGKDRPLGYQSALIFISLFVSFSYSRVGFGSDCTCSWSLLIFYFS